MYTSRVPVKYYGLSMALLVSNFDSSAFDFTVQQYLERPLRVDMFKHFMREHTVWIARNIHVWPLTAMLNFPSNSNDAGTHPPPPYTHTGSIMINPVPTNCTYTA